MRYLTAEQVLFIHARVIGETGGPHGVRDIGLLQSAVARPQATFDGQELYPDVFSKAAALMTSLARNHVFLDGNKRTALTATGVFLRMNNRSFKASQDELVQFILAVAVAVGKLSDSETAKWFKKHSALEKK